MIIRINKEDQAVVQSFVETIKNFNIAKPHQKSVRDFYNDVRSGQIRPATFNHVYPVLQSMHAQLHMLLHRVGKYGNIPKWKRVLVIPAVIQFVALKIHLRRQGYQKNLTTVALALTKIKQQAQPAKKEA